MFSRGARLWLRRAWDTDDGVCGALAGVVLVLCSPAACPLDVSGAGRTVPAVFVWEGPPALAPPALAPPHLPTPPTLPPLPPLLTRVRNKNAAPPSPPRARRRVRLKGDGRDDDAGAQTPRNESRDYLGRLLERMDGL